MMKMLILSSCQMMDISVSNEAKWYCSAFIPISWSSKDTQGSIIQIKAHNAAWVALCDNKVVYEQN